MLLSQSSSDMDIDMLCHRSPLQLYNIGELQSAVGDMKQHLMFVHAISGCDIVSVPYLKGQMRATGKCFLPQNVDSLVQRGTD